MSDCLSVDAIILLRSLDLRQLRFGPWLFLVDFFLRNIDYCFHFKRLFIWVPNLRCISVLVVVNRVGDLMDINRICGPYACLHSILVLRYLRTQTNLTIFCNNIIYYSYALFLCSPEIIFIKYIRILLIIWKT